MLIPKCPTVKPGFTFGDTAFHQLKQDLGKEIVECFRWMQKNTVVPSYQDVLGRFISAVPCTVNIRDFTRLPYPASGPRDLAGRGKLACVYTLCSWCVQSYWDLCIDGVGDGAAIRAHLAHLRAVWGRGVEKCKLVGNAREGFVLEVE